jgi:hypothetical protein
MDANGREAGGPLPIARMAELVSIICYVGNAVKGRRNEKIIQNQEPYPASRIVRHKIIHFGAGEEGSAISFHSSGPLASLLELLHVFPV